MKNLFLHELFHFSTGLGVGLLSAWVFKNPWFIPVGFFFGFLIDIDHFFDYFLWAGPKLNLKDFLTPEKYIRANNKVFVPLHGWEFALLVWYLSRLSGITGLEWAVTPAFLVHLVFDHLTLKKHPLAYFFSFRLFNKFSLKKFNGKANPRG